MIQGHRIRIATVDLCQPWQAIDSRLRSLISSGDHPAAGDQVALAVRRALLRANET